MRHMKKAASLLLALVMVLSLMPAALAAGNGSITIDNAVGGQTYTIYRILELESYNKDAGAYSYKATADWKNFIEGAEIKGTYVNVDDQGYVTWVKDADAAAFAKLAQAYATEKNIGNQGTQKATSTTVKFENLDLGYYLVDSSLGTLCSLDTTNPDVTIKEKNTEPTNVKEVQEDSNSNYGSWNDADIGQTVNFKSTITAQAGAENYVFHDKMSAGLTYTGVTSVTLNGVAVDASNYTVNTTGLTDGCTFEVEFTQAFCDTLKANEKIVISYTATLNANAVVGSEGNPNESWLKYGDSNNTTTTPPSTTKTYTWKVDVFKYTKDGDSKKGLSGAEFVLYKVVDNVKYYAVADVNKKITGWTPEGVKPETDADASKTYATVFTTPQDGNFSITGLDADTYYLEEIKAPAGYNQLKDPLKIKITSATGEDGTVTAAIKCDDASVTTVEVENNTGTELPSTGGMGTTVFYVLGSVLVLGAVVLLVTKKRMGGSNA